MSIFKSVQTWESPYDLDELVRVNGVWVLRRYLPQGDEYEALPLTEPDAARWLLEHLFPLPEEVTWGGSEGDTLHYGLGRWLLATEYRPQPEWDYWEVGVKELTEPLAYAWLVHNAYHLTDTEGAPRPEREPQGGGPSTHEEARFRFQRVGDMWSIRFGEEAGNFKHSVGLAYIALLLARPNTYLPAVELQNALRLPQTSHPVYRFTFHTTGADVGGVPRRLKPLACADEVATDNRSTQRTLDTEALQNYHNRLRAIEDELTAANRDNDTGRRTSLIEEKERILGEVQKVVGLGGKARQLGPPTPDERARVAVRQALRRAYKQMGSGRRPLSGLVKHLDTSIITSGTSCMYNPVRPAPAWEL
jgi:hypothetical protein